MKRVVEALPELLMENLSMDEIQKLEEKKKQGGISTSESFESQYKPTLLPNKEVVIPLLHGERRIGHLHFRGYKNDILTKTDEVFFTTIASSMAVAFDDLRHREAEAISIRLEAELEAASMIQTNLLPGEREFHRIPTVLDVHGYYKAAERTGGDWYGHHFDAERNQFYFYVSDVTGHGIASALLTGVACGSVFATTHSLEYLMKENQNLNLSIEDRLKILNEVVNKTIYETGKSKYLMSMVFFGIDLNTGMLSYVNAGHPSPYIYFEKMNQVQVPSGAGSLLGLNFELDSEMSGDLVVVHKTQLNKGDTIIIYTDGLIENSSKDGRVLTRKRLRNILQEQSGEAAGENVWMEHPPADDLTVLALKYLG
jgi:serine phosphatase RsbU (regulator of sigma subunit)